MSISKRRFDWCQWVLIAVALIGAGVIVLTQFGCQASTKIEGGKSEAKAVTEEVRPKTTTTTTITIQLPKESK